MSDVKAPARYCPACGAQNLPLAQKCASCGHDFLAVPPVPPGAPAAPAQAPVQPAPQWPPPPIGSAGPTQTGAAWPPAGVAKSKAVTPFQVIRLIACFVAAALFGLAGLQMTGIESEAGNTIKITRRKGCIRSGVGCVNVYIGGDA